ncbi:MAG: hypothetical protein R8N23_10645 [Reichenbachiella sp.]|uniref:hypothetical protein n=1 Tax=Reichenbachiella sp. TaxID=2184521 RepID=UPI002966F747|nr:hypothetical protein [Reichenbachiella sp.]MDW3210317.1 hypothetical protein [Reichenbachiella sp.]
MRPIAYKAILLESETYTLADLWAGYSLESIAKKSQIEKVLTEFNDSDFKTFDESFVKKADDLIIWLTVMSTK